MRRLLAGALALVGLVGTAPVHQALAQDGAPLTGTLAAISARGSILIGVRDAAIPFSFQNRAGQPVGFSVDICKGIAADVAALLNRDLLAPDAQAWENGLRVVYVTVSADARLPSLVSGAIDLECGSTTGNAERARTVAFSPVFFLAGTKLLAGSGVASYRDLAGKTVAVSAGTTNAAVLHRMAASVAPPMTVVETPGLPGAWNLLASGKAAAMASDDILLSGLLATHTDEHRFAVVGDYLSFEPYAIGLRRDDPQFADLVRSSFERMAADDTLATRYRRWFNDQLPTGETLAVPMSAQLTEMYRALGQPD